MIIIKVNGEHKELVKICNCCGAALKDVKRNVCEECENAYSCQLFFQQYLNKKEKSY